MVKVENKKALLNFCLEANLGTLAILKKVNSGTINNIGVSLKSLDK
jgi:hypothetical protein